MQLLIFRMGKEMYGFRLEDVTEVVGHIQLLQIPRVPPPYEGIFQLRGRIVALLNLADCFGMEGGVRESEVLILQPPSFALRVPGLVESMHTVTDDLRPASDEGIGAVLDGIVCENEELYHVLSVNKLLNHAHHVISAAENVSRIAGG